MYISIDGSEPIFGSKVNIEYKDKEEQTLLALNYFYKEEAAVEEAFLKAGFQHFQWVRHSTETLGEDPYWKDFIKHAPTTFFVAEKHL